MGPLLLLLLLLQGLDAASLRESDLTQLGQELRDLRSEVSHLRTELREHKKSNAQERDDINYQLQKALSSNVFSPGTNSIQPPVYACVDGSASMTCDAGSSITVLRAEYGRYADDCSLTCCEPNDADCTELMADVNATEWQSVKDTCDGQMTCDYAYDGHVLSVCANNRTADYVQLLYHCTDFVGFSAYSQTRQFPENGDIIEFGGVEMNVGGGYDNINYVFTCPRHGYYYVYYNVQLFIYGDDTLACYVGMRRDGSVMATSGDWIDGDTNHRGTSSQSALLECEEGSEIWLEADNGDYCELYLSSSSLRYSTFGAFLLRPLQ